MVHQLNEEQVYDLYNAWEACEKRRERDWWNNILLVRWEDEVWVEGKLGEFFGNGWFFHPEIKNLANDPSLMWGMFYPRLQTLRAKCNWCVAMN